MRLLLLPVCGLPKGILKSQIPNPNLNPPLDPNYAFN
jgi:hypothetical protein